MSVISTLVVKLVGDISDFTGKMDTAQTKLSSIGQSMTRTGVGLTAGVTAPIAGMGVMAVMAASDLDESMNKVRVVFGENADEMLKWSDNSSTAFGLARQDALEAAGTFGNLFDAMGIGAKEQETMSKSLVQLAGDLASFNNIDPTVALEKLRSGIVGEVEPMRALGVNVSATAVALKAVEMGLVEAGAKATELTPAQKAMAAYQIIMEQTTNSQGDFARTSDGFANSLRIVKADTLTLAASFGKELIPYAEKLLSGIRNLLSWFSNLSPEMRKTIVIVAAIAAAIGPLLVVLGMLATAVSALSWPILLIVGVVALLAAAWATNFGGIQEKTAAVVEFIKGIIAAFLANIQAWWAANGEAILAKATEVWTAIQTAIQTVITVISTVVSFLLGEIQRWWSENGAAVMTIVTTAWNAIRNAITVVVNVIQTVVSTVLNWLSAFWQANGEKIKTATSIVWNIIKTVISTVLDVIGGIVRTFAAILQGDWEGGLNILKDTAKKAWDGIKKVFDDAKTLLLGAVRTLIEAIRNAWINFEWNKLGGKLIEGIMQGVRNAKDRLLGLLQEIVDKAIGAIKAKLGIKSPSVVMMKIGMQTIEGLTKGLDEAPVIQAGLRVTDRMIDALNPGNSLAYAVAGNSGNTYETHYHVSGTFMPEPEETITDRLRVLVGLTRA